MNRTAYIFVPGIYNRPGNPHAATDRAVTWVNNRLTCDVAEKFEYLALPATRNLLAARLVAAGLGVAVMHPVTAGSLVEGVVSLPFRPALPFTYALLERADLGYGVLAQELEQALRQAWLAQAGQGE